MKKNIYSVDNYSKAVKKNFNRVETASFGAIRFHFGASRFDFGAFRFCFDGLSINFDKLGINFGAIRFFPLAVTIFPLVVRKRFHVINGDKQAFYPCLCCFLLSFTVSLLSLHPKQQITRKNEKNIYLYFSFIGIQ